jgi:hypothetical protein
VSLTHVARADFGACFHVRSPELLQRSRASGPTREGVSQYLLTEN